MPKVTIWIREEDYPSWQDIDNKPAWLHGHLKKQLYKGKWYTQKELGGVAQAVMKSGESFSTHEPRLTPPEEAL